MGSFGYMIYTLARPLFGWFARWLGGALPLIAGFFGSALTQFLVSLGWGVTTFVGFNAGTDYLLQAAVSGFEGVPAAVPQLLGLMWFDKAFNLILSAGMAVMVLKGLRMSTGKMSRGSFGGGGSNS